MRAFVPVCGLLHSVEADVFISTGSDGDSVKKFSRGKQIKTNPLVNLCTFAQDNMEEHQRLKEVNFPA